MRKTKPDTSLAINTGHFNLLITQEGWNKKGGTVVVHFGKCTTTGGTDFPLSSIRESELDEFSVQFDRRMTFA